MCRPTSPFLIILTIMILTRVWRNDCACQSTFICQAHFMSFRGTALRSGKSTMCRQTVFKERGVMSQFVPSCLWKYGAGECSRNIAQVFVLQCRNDILCLWIGWRTYSNTLTAAYEDSKTDMDRTIGAVCFGFSKACFDYVQGWPHIIVALCYLHVLGHNMSSLSLSTLVWMA